LIDSFLRPFDVLVQSNVVSKLLSSVVVDDSVDSSPTSTVWLILFGCNDGGEAAVAVAVAVAVDSPTNFPSKRIRRTTTCQ